MAKGSVSIKTSSILAVSMALASFGSNPASAQTKADYIIENVHVIPMHEERAIENQAVAVRDGTIVAIIDASNSQKIDAKTRIDGEGRFLMPGLADMHVHVRWDPQAMFNLFVAHGVTTVANMFIKDGGSISINHTDLRTEVENGKRIGPRYLLAGEHFQDDYPSSIEEVEQVLVRHVANRYDFIKVHGDLAPDVYDALINGAKARDLRIIGHTQHLRPLKDSLRLDAIEHAEELLYVSPDPDFGKKLKEDFLSTYRQHAESLRDPSYRAPIVEEIARSGIYLDPTIIVYKMIGEWASDSKLLAIGKNPLMGYLPQSVKSRWLSLARNPYQEEGFPITPAELDRNVETLLMLVKDLSDAGVPLLLGTDTFGTLVPGYSAHQELELLVQAGLTPFEALRTGTVNIAAYLEEADEAGEIRPGFRADFILLDRNPLTDILNSRSVSGVFTQNRWHGRSDIMKLKQEAMKH